MKLDVIGLSGKIGTGKDYIAKTYLFPLGYKNFSLAWHFKIEGVGLGIGTFEEIFKTKPQPVRHWLQQRGTEEGRMKYGEDIWVETLFAWLELLNKEWGINKFVIPDVRFPNEVEGIRSRGGRVFRIHAPLRNASTPMTDDARNHTSETALDDYPIEKFDGIIFNEKFTESTVGFQINRLLGNPPSIFSSTTFSDFPDLEDEFKLLNDLSDKFDKMGDKLDQLFEVFSRKL